MRVGVLADNILSYSQCVVREEHKGLDKTYSLLPRPFARHDI